MIKRICVFLLLFSCAPAWSVPPEPLPYMLDEMTTLKDARERLLMLRDKGMIRQDEMLDLARKLEPKLRGNELRDLGVMDHGKNKFAIERSGSSPELGRGIFSDEDLEIKDFEQMKRLREWAKDKKFKISENNRYMFKIEEADTVVWKPGVPAPANEAAQIERAQAQALEPEFASGSKPGAAPHAAESTLENMTKASKAFFKKLPPGYEGELELIAGAKDVVRSMKAAGMCVGDAARVCQNLEDFRSMRKSPKDLGLDNLEETQVKLRKLMKEAFQESQKQFKNEFAELAERLKSAGSASERELLMQQAAEMKNRAIRMGARFEVLSEQYPKMMEEMSGGKSIKRFWGEQTEKIRALNKSAEAAAGNVTLGRTLNVTLNMLVFVECMSQEKTAMQSARVRQAGQCTLQAAGGLAFGELVSQGIGYVAFYFPSGALVATGGITAAGILYSSYEVWSAAVAYNDMRQAIDEADSNEKNLEYLQRRNMATFPGRLAAEEAMISDTLREIAVLKKWILNDLETLASEEADLTGSMDLQARRARLNELAAYLKSVAEACFQEQSLPCQKLPASDNAQKAARASSALDALAEARMISGTLKEKASLAAIVLEETKKIKGRVQDLNEYVKLKKTSLRTRMEAFTLAFPEDFLNTVNANSPRLTMMEADIQRLAPMAEEEWHGSWQDIFDKDSKLRALRKYEEEELPQVKRVVNDMSDCLARTGKGGICAANSGGAPAGPPSSVGSTPVPSSGPKPSGQGPVKPEQAEKVLALAAGYSNKNVKMTPDKCEKWPGTIPTWDESTHKGRCVCPTGMRWLKSQNMCVKELTQAECRKWPGTKPHWHEPAKKMGCLCPDNTRWVKKKNACISTAMAGHFDPEEGRSLCAKWQGTHPRWKEAIQKIECIKCLDGFHWAQSKNSCVADQRDSSAETSQPSEAPLGFIDAFMRGYGASVGFQNTQPANENPPFDNPPADFGNSASLQSEPDYTTDTRPEQPSSTRSGYSQKEIERMQKELACLKEGKRKYGSAAVDCNGSYMIGSRDGKIEWLEKELRKAGYPPAPDTARSHPNPDGSYTDKDGYTVDGWRGK